MSVDSIAKMEWNVSSSIGQILDEQTKRQKEDDKAVQDAENGS